MIKKKNPSKSGNWDGLREGIDSNQDYFGQQ